MHNGRSYLTARHIVTLRLVGMQLISINPSKSINQSIEMYIDVYNLHEILNIILEEIKRGKMFLWLQRSIIDQHNIAGKFSFRK